MPVRPEVNCQMNVSEFVNERKGYQDYRRVIGGLSEGYQRVIRVIKGLLKGY